MDREKALQCDGLQVVAVAPPFMLAMELWTSRDAFTISMFPLEKRTPPRRERAVRMLWFRNRSKSRLLSE